MLFFSFFFPSLSVQPETVFHSAGKVLTGGRACETAAFSSADWKTCVQGESVCAQGREGCT